MDCTICGKATLPGAMLCVPCKAALKRARYVTVQESLRRPSVIDARRLARRARPKEPIPEPAILARHSRPPDRVPEISPSARVSPDAIKTFHAGSRVFVVLLFVAALGGAAYFGQRELSANAWGGGSVATAAAPPAMVDKVATPQPAAVEPAPAMVPPPAAAVPETPPEVKPAAAAPKRKTLATRATFATADGDPPDAVAPPPEPEKPAPVPAPPPPRPAPDRWQNMRDAQAECDRMGMFDGLICGQRVRIQYCEGYWGKVAQCQGANAGYER